MPCWRLYYHVVWSTRERLPIIQQEIERDVQRLIIGAARRNNVEALAIGGVEDHVHLVISVPPSTSIAEAISRIKGASSHAIRQRYNAELDHEFRWQAEYGAISISESHLDRVCAYVRNQRRRHELQKLVPGLEQITVQR